MQVSVRELKAHLSRYIAAAKAGQTVEISSHRKVVAYLRGAPDAQNAGLQRLIAEGTAEWSGCKPGGARIRLAAGDQTLSDIVLEDRG